MQPLTVRSKAPLRLGLAGGGSDVPPFVDLYGGAVLSVTVNLYGWCTIRPLAEPLIHIHSTDNAWEGVYHFADALPEDCPAQLIRGVYNRVVRDFGPVPTPGFEIWTANDAPAGSGLGTSSTMVVTILRAFLAWKKRPLGAMETARLAWEIERQDLGLAGGKQDQWAAALGGFNLLEFHTDGSVSATPLRVSPRVCDELESSMVLYFTGRSRSSAAIIREQQRNTSSGNTVAIDAMHRIRESSYAMRDALLAGDVPGLARILGAAWEDKKKMAGAITNPVIQEAFDTAMAAGAVAGKVSGAGGGGFMMLMAPPEKKPAVVAALSALPGGRIVPFEFTRRGVRSWTLRDTL